MGQIGRERKAWPTHAIRPTVAPASWALQQHLQRLTIRCASNSRQQELMTMRSESNKKLGPYNITILKIHHCYERTTSRFILEIPVSLEKNMHKKQTKKRTLERKSEQGNETLGKKTKSKSKKNKEMPRKKQANKARKMQKPACFPVCVCFFPSPFFPMFNVILFRIKRTGDDVLQSWL